MNANHASRDLGRGKTGAFHQRCIGCARLYRA
jgi:hypothetical protein